LFGFFIENMWLEYFKKCFKIILGKNGFAKVSKNLNRYESKNVFVWTIKIIM